MGHGDATHRYAPTKVEGLDNEVVVDVRCGACSTLAMTSSGLHYFFGWDTGTNLNIMKPRIQRNMNWEKAISISIRGSTAFITEHGELYTTLGFTRDGMDQ